MKVRKLPTGPGGFQYVEIGRHWNIEHETDRAALFIIRGREFWIPKACLAVSYYQTGRTYQDQHGAIRDIVEHRYHVLRKVAYEKQIPIDDDP